MSHWPTVVNVNMNINVDNVAKCRRALAVCGSVWSSKPVGLLYILRNKLFVADCGETTVRNSVSCERVSRWLSQKLLLLCLTSTLPSETIALSQIHSYIIKRKICYVKCL